MMLQQDCILLSCYALYTQRVMCRSCNIGLVHEHAFFLKDLNDARLIRQRILECFERASNPAIPDNERDQLLTFVVVGGGPTR